MKADMPGTSEVSTDELVADLTREIPNYIDRIVREVGVPVSELWSVVLAASGRMAYIEKSPVTMEASGKLGVPDHPIGGGRTRFETWKSALVLVIEILGDPEARYRTGVDTATLSMAVEQFFSTG